MLMTTEAGDRKHGALVDAWLKAGQRSQLRSCSHIVPCASDAACDALTALTLHRMHANKKLWSRSTWGNMQAHMQMSAAWHDLNNALGGATDEQMGAVRSALGEERFRCMLNAYERLGGFVFEPGDGRPPAVLP